ncbi:MAG TPA: hypothetical protein VMW58_06800 [Anaerolineae bacterium]|nr:hypothetical protein [Anaerolineae bacterium]
MREWGKQKRLDAVVWTDLPSNWDDPPRDCLGEVTQPLNEDNIIAYLRSLPAENLYEAERYIRFAPEQVQTLIRRRIEDEFGW